MAFASSPRPDILMTFRRFIQEGVNGHLPANQSHTSLFPDNRAKINKYVMLTWITAVCPEHYLTDLLPEGSEDSCNWVAMAKSEWCLNISCHMSTPIAGLRRSMAEILN